jgi:dynein heavy chain
VPFVIQALDTLNDRRTTGGDRFAVRVVSSDGKVEGEAVVHDLADGKYEVYYSVPLPGSYLVHVSHADLGGTDAIPVRGSPFKVSAVDPWTKHRLLGSTPAVAKVGAQHRMLVPPVCRAVTWLSSGQTRRPICLTAYQMQA